MVLKSTEESLNVARAGLLSSTDAPSISFCTTDLERQNAAQAFLGDFSRSIESFSLSHAERRATAPKEPAATEKSSQPFVLSSGNFPRLGQGTPTVPGVQSKEVKARKKITPSRVSAADAPLGGTMLSSSTPARDMASLLSDRATKGSRSGDSEPALTSKHTAKLANPVVSRLEECASTASTADLRSATANPVIVRAAKLHAFFISNTLYPEQTLCTSLAVLLDALRLGQVTGDSPRKAPETAGRGLFAQIDACYTCRAHFCGHAIVCFSSLHSLISLLPHPVISAFSMNPILGEYVPDIARLAVHVPHFPSPKEPVPFSVRDSGLRPVSSPWEEASAAATESSPRRLIANLENVWDLVMDLQRIHRGDNALVPAGSLQRDAASRAVRALHPANMDAFAARFITLITASALKGEVETDRLTRLSARMTAAQPLAAPMAANKSGKKKMHSSSPSTPASGVILHRIPGLVRQTYAGDGAELFYLEFLDGADSAKLCDALAPRLSSALFSALASASGAHADEIFTDAVLLARLHAKMLSAILHLGNWAHSSASFSGDSDSVESDGLANSLPVAVARMRAARCSASWRSCIDLAGILHESLASKHAPAVLAAVLVADVVLRLAVVDPVASWTNWFSASVDSLRQVDAKKNPWLVNAPSVRCVVEELFFTLRVPIVARNGEPDNSTVGHGDESGVPGRSVGDIRLIQACIPCLEDLRRKLSDSFAPRLLTGLQRRRIRPLPTSTGDGEPAGSAFRLPPKRVQAVDPIKLGVTQEAEQLDSDTVTAQLKDFDKFSLVAPPELWAEFFRRMDKRLRCVVELVMGAGNDKRRGTMDPRDVMRQAALLLVPDTPQSVVDVVSEYCGVLQQLERTLQGKNHPLRVEAGEQLSAGMAKHEASVLDKNSVLDSARKTSGSPCEEKDPPADVDAFVDAVWSETKQAAFMVRILSEANISISISIN